MRFREGIGAWWGWVDNERAMDRGSSPAAMSMPPYGSLFIGELNLVSELLAW